MHAVLDYLYPENNCKPVKNVYFFQVNYLCEVHLLDDTDKAHDFSNITQNVFWFRKSSSRIFPPPKKKLFIGK